MGEISGFTFGVMEIQDKKSMYNKLCPVIHRDQTVPCDSSRQKDETEI